MTCISCEILNPVAEYGESYARTCFDALSSGCSQIFVGFFLIWFLSVISKMLLDGQFEQNKVLKHVLLYSLILFSLKGHSEYWEYIYNPIKETTLGLMSTIIQASGNIPNDKGLVLNNMLESVESHIVKVFDFSSHLAENASWGDKLTVSIMGFVLSLPFVFFWGIFASYTLEYLLKLSIVSALSPLLLIVAAFDVTRHYFWAGIKIILLGALTTCVAAAAMGLTLVSIKTTLAGINLQGETGRVWTIFYQLLLLGLVSVIFQLRARSIAAGILGAESGSLLPQLVAGATGAGLLYAGSKALQVTKWAGSPIFNLGKNAAGQAYQSVRQKLSGQSTS